MMITTSNLTVRLWGKKYTLQSNEELEIPIPQGENFILFKTKSRALKYPLSQLLTQRPLDLTSKGMPLQVQYLYQASDINLTREFPDINAETYRELLLHLALVTQEPSVNLNWIVTEFERRYAISSITRVKTFLQIALETQVFFNAYSLCQLGIMLYNTEDKTIISDECQQLLERLKTHLIRFDFIYSSPNREFYQGAIGAIIFLIQLLDPKSNETLISCISEHVEWNYKMIKMNAEKGIPCDSADVSTLAKTTHAITQTLIHFETEFRHEFSPYFNMHSVLATQFYYRLRHDIHALKIALTNKTMTLYNNLRILHKYLISNNLIDLGELLLLKDVFNPAVTDYLLNVENRFHEFIPNLLKQDSFQPINRDCYYSHSIRDLFAFISYNIDYVLQFRFCSHGQKLYLLSIIEGILEEYMHYMIETKVNTLLNTYVEPNHLEPTAILPIYVTLHNVISLRPQFISLINDLKQTAATIDYNLENLDKKINQTINVLISHIAVSIPIDLILQRHITNENKLIDAVYSYICVILSQNMPHHITIQLFNQFFIQIIHWFENQILNKSLTIEHILPILPQLITLFHGEGNGVNQDTLLKHCCLLSELEESLHIKWTLNEIQNHSVFVLQALTPEKLSLITKSVHQLHYPREKRFLGLYKCHKGYLFEMNDTVDFISKNRKKTIHLGEKMPEVKGGRIQSGVYAKSIKGVTTLFSKTKPSSHNVPEETSANVHVMGHT